METDEDENGIEGPIVLTDSTPELDDFTIGSPHFPLYSANAFMKYFPFLIPQIGMHLMHFRKQSLQICWVALGNFTAHRS